MASDAYTRREEAQKALNEAKARGDVIRKEEEAKNDQVYRDEVDALVRGMQANPSSQIREELQDIFNRRTNNYNKIQHQYYKSYWPELIEYSKADKALTNYLA